MHMRMVVYVRHFGDTLVSVPNTPAWECDVCHEREFDPAGIQRIEMLVGQAGPPPNHHPTEKSHPAEPVASAKKTAKESTGTPKSTTKAAKTKTKQPADESSTGKPPTKAKL